MRNNKLNYVIVGSFVLAMVFGLIFSIAMLTGRAGATDSYYAMYKNVTGVKFGAQVLYEGYPIGQVEEVTPVSDGAAMTFRVDFTVKKDWVIPEDSIAKIAAPGLLSAITLSIKAGKSEDPLNAGSEVIGQEAANVFNVVSSVADQVNSLAEQDIRPLLMNINPLLKSLTNSSDNFGQLLEGVGARVPKIAGDIEVITSGMSGMLTEEKRVQIDGLISNVDIAAANFTDLSVNLDGLIKDLNSVLKGNKNNLDESIVDVRYVTDTLARHIDALTQNMESTSRNMYEFSRQIRLNPGLLMGGTPPRDEAQNK